MYFELTVLEMSRYKTFVSPFAKVFLGAIFTYQVIYWTWLKLETDEIKVEKNSAFFPPLLWVLTVTNG